MLILNFEFAHHLIACSLYWLTDCPTYWLSNYIYNYRTLILTDSKDRLITYHSLSDSVPLSFTYSRLHPVNLLCLTRWPHALNGLLMDWLTDWLTLRLNYVLLADDSLNSATTVLHLYVCVVFDFVFWYGYNYGVLGRWFGLMFVCFIA